MRRRGARITVLCEDEAQERFARQVCYKLGYHRREVYAARYPSGRGSGEQWVCERYAVEVRAHRRERTHQNVELLVVVDADTHTVEQRKRRLGEKLGDAGLAPRSNDEPIVIWVPKRCLETWLLWLAERGEVDEETPGQTCKNLVRDDDWKTAPARFVDYYRRPDQTPEPLPSMADALIETRRLSVS